VTISLVDVYIPGRTAEITDVALLLSMAVVLQFAGTGGPMQNCQSRARGDNHCSPNWCVDSQQMVVCRDKQSDLRIPGAYPTEKCDHESNLTDRKYDTQTDSAKSYTKMSRLDRAAKCSRSPVYLYVPKRD